MNNNVQCHVVIVIYLQSKVILIALEQMNQLNSSIRSIFSLKNALPAPTNGQMMLKSKVTVSYILLEMTKCCCSNQNRKKKCANSTHSLPLSTFVYQILMHSAFFNQLMLVNFTHNIHGIFISIHLMGENEDE